MPVRVGRSRRLLLVAVLVACTVAVSACVGVMAPRSADRTKLGIVMHDGGSVVDVACPMEPVAGPGPVALSAKRLQSAQARLDAMGVALPRKTLKEAGLGTLDEPIAPLFVLTPASVQVRLLGSFESQGIGVTSLCVQESFLPLQPGERVRSLSAPVDSEGAFIASDRSLFAFPAPGDDPVDYVWRMTDLEGGWDVSADFDAMRVLVADGIGGAKVLDLSDETPTVIAQMLPVPAPDVRGFSAEATLACVTDRASDRLYVYDLTDSTDPVLVGSAPVTDPGKVVLSEGHALVGSDTGLRIFDLSDTAAPSELSSVPLAAVTDLKLSGPGTLYVTAGTELIGVDFSDASAPFVEGSLAYEHDTTSVDGFVGFVMVGQGVGGFDINGDGFEGGIHQDFPMDAHDVLSVGNEFDGFFAYVADGQHGIKVEKLLSGLTAGAIPLCVGSVPASDAVAIDTDVDVLFAVDDDELKTYDISEPGTPTALGAVDIGDGSSDVAVGGWVALVAGNAEGLQVVDCSEPSAPSIVASVPGSPALSVALDMPAAFVGRADGTLQAVALDAETPEVIGSLSLPGPVQDIVLDGPLAYVSCGSAGVFLIDRGDGTDMSVVDSLDTPGAARASALEDGRLIVADETSVRSMSTSEGAALADIGHYGPMPAMEVEPGFLEGMAQVAAGPQGYFAVMPDEQEHVARITRVDGETEVAFPADSAYDTTIVAHAVMSPGGMWPEVEYAYEYFAGTGSYESIDATSSYANVPEQHVIELYTRGIGGDFAAAKADFRIISFDRTAGLDRFRTSVALSEQYYGEGVTPEVVIATGKDFPDALCAAPLAKSLGAPVLLVGDSLSASATAEIQRLGATHATVLGKTTSVSSAVESQIRSAMNTTAPSAVTRIGGNDRYDTARLIALELAAREGTPTEVYVATGLNYPDALAVAGLAAAQKRAILLTRADYVPTPTRLALQAIDPDGCLLLGDTRAVPDSAWWGESPERFSGANRYATAKAVVEAALADSFTNDHVFVATGKNFPDALSVGPICATLGAPLVLVEPTYVPTPSSRLVDEQHKSILRLHVLGSTSSVSDDVFGDLLDLLRYIPLSN